MEEEGRECGTMREEGRGTMREEGGRRVEGGTGGGRGSGEVVQQDAGDEYKLRLGSRGRDDGMKGELRGAKSKRSLHRYQMQLVRLQESRTRAKINQEKALASYGAHVTGASLLQVPTSWDTNIQCGNVYTEKYFSVTIFFNTLDMNIFTL